MRDDPSLGLLPIMPVIMRQAILECRRQTNGGQALRQRMVGRNFAIGNDAVKIENDRGIGQALIHRGARRFPIAASVKRFHGHIKAMAFIDAVEIDAPAIGVRARLIKAFDATGFAKEVVRRPGSKSIAGQCRLVCFKNDIAMRHNQMQKSGRRTNRAITIAQLHHRRNRCAKLHRAAMTPALNLHRHRHR